MAAPTYLASNTALADATSPYSVAPAPAAHAVNDILISPVMMSNGAQDPALAGTGWALIDQVVGTPRFKWAWKRATATSGEGPTWTATGTGTLASNVHTAARGAETTGTPWDFATPFGDATTSDTTPDAPTVTTLGTNRLVLVVLAAVAVTFPTVAGAWTNPDESSVATGTGFQTVAFTQTLATAQTLTASQLGTWGAGHVWAGLILGFFEPGNGPVAGVSEGWGVVT